MGRSYARIEGTDETIRNLGRINDAVLAELEQAVMPGTEVVAESARQKVPVDTGKLKESIQARVTKKNASGVTVIVAAGTDEYYWLFIEFGTSKMPAQPFLRPALDENRAAVKREFGAQLKAIIGEVTGGD